MEAMSAPTSQLQSGPLAASLAEEKRARKQAEDDALRLYNRIRQLEKEEERADRCPPCCAQLQVLSSACTLCAGGSLWSNVLVTSWTEYWLT